MIKLHIYQHLFLLACAPASVFATNNTPSSASTPSETVAASAEAAKESEKATQGPLLPHGQPFTEMPTRYARLDFKQKTRDEREKEVKEKVAKENAKFEINQFCSTDYITLQPQEKKNPELLFELLPKPAQELSLRLRMRSLLGLTDEKPANTVLFHGPPGTGKTETAHLIAKDGGLHFISMPATGLINKYQNSGPETFDKLLEQANEHHKKTGEGSLIFLDECDAVGHNDDGEDSTIISSHRSEKATIMHIWQKVLELKNDPRYVFAFATNSKDKLHKTFISRFREDHIIEFKLPDAAQRKLAFEYYLQLNNYSLEKELNIDKKTAEQVFTMLVKHSDKMNTRAIADAVSSFKGNKSLKVLNDEDRIQIAKYLKETKPAELEELKTKLKAQQSAEDIDKIDHALIDLYEKLSGKQLCKKASTAKELYEILQRTKAKDGYSFTQMLERLDKQLDKGDKWLYRVNRYIKTSAILYGCGSFVTLYLLKSYFGGGNQQNAPQSPQLDSATVLKLIQLAGVGAGAAGATIAVGVQREPTQN